MEHFTPIASLIGGILIGLSGAILLLFNGKIAGISGILRGIFDYKNGDTFWRVAFLGGLVTGGFILRSFAPHLFHFGIDRSTASLVLAGFLVGLGARVGNGCTSGHGVCGISRLSPRSIIATVIFIVVGAATVYLVNHVFAGAV